MFSEGEFRVVVEVIDVQGLIWPAPTVAERAAAARGAHRKVGKLPSPFVDVLVGGISQSTAVREATATCSFNRMFVFSDIPFDETIDVRVCHKTLLSHELIGSYVTSLREIRNLPTHRMAQTLCPLIVRDAPSEPRGFVRLTITVLKPGEAVEVGEEEGGPRGGAGRILYTPELDFESYNLNVDIHMGLDLLKCASPPGAAPPSCHVRVEFASTELRTATQQSARSPTWNETLRFPARVPCSSDRIVLELWDAQTRISTAYLSFEAILKGEMKPTWVNFYSETQRRRESRRESLGAFAAFAALFELDDEEEEADTATEFLYLGRILVSACCVKHKSPPSAQSHPCRPVEPPHSQEYTLWGDLFDISGLHKIVDTSVDVAFGDWLVRVSPETQTDEAVSFSAIQGRLPEHVAFLPTQLDSCYDVIVRIYGRLQSEGGQIGMRQFIAYTRLNAFDLIKKSGAPEWILLARTTRTVQPAAGSNPIYLLAGFKLEKGIDVRMRNIERPERPVFHLVAYKLHASFFQAVTLGGNSVTTQTIFYTTHPDWNEMLTFDCTLPSAMHLSRDLVIQIISGKTVLGELCLPMEYLATPEAHEPQWYSIDSLRFPKNRAKLLCCFRLITPGSPEEAIPCPEPEFGPKYEPYDLRIFVVGVRLFSSVTANRAPDSTPPKLQLEFGRAPGQPNVRQFVECCQSAVKGSNGNFNFLNPFELKCFLPTNKLMQSYLDIRVFSQLDSGQSEIGTAYLHLTSSQPGIPNQIQETVELVY